MSGLGRQIAAAVLVWLVGGSAIASGAGAWQGYYRMPTIHGNIVVFVAHGDLWRVSGDGGQVEQLTSHPDEESYPVISPDGLWLAYSAQVEGPKEVYVMPLAGGPSRRLTYDGGGNARVQGWTRDGRVLYATTIRSKNQGAELYAVHPGTLEVTAVPLANAAEGCQIGEYLYFARHQKTIDNVRNYRSGRTQSLWRFHWPLPIEREPPEAQQLELGFDGTNRQPMCADDRLYFLSERDGTMNVWSVSPSTGGRLQQHTRARGLEIRSAHLHGRRIVYQQGADIGLLDLVSGEARLLDVALPPELQASTPLEVRDPLSYLTQVALSPDGQRVAAVSRGQAWLIDVATGRASPLMPRLAAQARSVRFAPDNESIFIVSDASGEHQIWQHPIESASPPRQLTSAPPGLLMDAVFPSPDGRFIAYAQRDKKLVIRRLSDGREQTFGHRSKYPIKRMVWSPDSSQVAFEIIAANELSMIALGSVADGSVVELGSNRYADHSPAFSADGAFLYFVSARRFEAEVVDPMSPAFAGPEFRDRDGIFAFTLKDGAQWLFTSSAGRYGQVFEVPVPPGSYAGLATSRAHIFAKVGSAVVSIPVRPTKERLKPVALADGVIDYEVADGRMLVRSDLGLFVTSSFDAPSEEAPHLVRIDVKDWRLVVDQLAERRQVFVEAWRVHRDLFWDSGMHGADWQGVRQLYEPLVDRTTDRHELGDVIEQMVAEARAVHSSISNRVPRRGGPRTDVGKLGAELSPAAGGVRINAVLAGDGEGPNERSPLSDALVLPGDLIVAVDGVAVDSAVALARALAGKVQRPVKLDILRAGAKGIDQVSILPISAQVEYSLRLADGARRNREWVEAVAKGRIGYIHLRGTTKADLGVFFRGMIALWNREGLILDLRGNDGGSQSNWILERLQRKPWIYWRESRDGTVLPGPVGAFSGALAVLIDADTYSDSEHLAEGIRQLGLGVLIGTRTSGAGLSVDNSLQLSDGGKTRIGEAAPFVMSKDGPRWIVEGDGVEPDLVVDNLPHASFMGSDAQLSTAVTLLAKKNSASPAAPGVPPIPQRTRARAYAP